MMPMPRWPVVVVRQIWSATRWRGKQALFDLCVEISAPAAIASMNASMPDFAIVPNILISALMRY